MLTDSAIDVLYPPPPEIVYLKDSLTRKLLPRPDAPYLDEIT